MNSLYDFTYLDDEFRGLCFETDDSGYCYITEFGKIFLISLSLSIAKCFADLLIKAVRYSNKKK